MKAILFTQQDTVAFDELQQKIHLYLQSKIGQNGFKYSADKWADSASVDLYQEQLVMQIDEQELRYSYILEALTQEEIDSIQDINLE